MKAVTDVIDVIESEIKHAYLPGAIHWVDENYDDAWSKCLDRFDLALDAYAKTSNVKFAELEGEIYKSSVLEFVKRYKHAMANNSTLDLFAELAKMQVNESEVRA